MKTAPICTALSQTLFQAVATPLISCGDLVSLWIASCIINRSVLRLSSVLPHYQRGRGILKAAVCQGISAGQPKTKRNQNETRDYIHLHFPESPSSEYKEEQGFFCLCCVIVSEGFDVPAVRDSLKHRPCLTTGHVLCNPPQMKSSSFRQPASCRAIHQTLEIQSAEL